ncbi:MAG: hypothetical protein JXR97_05170 [Planctomycetes bacterium]|nr:hypothetical protein [Planctomycetota bacterium]
MSLMGKLFGGKGGDDKKNSKRTSARRPSSASASKRAMPKKPSTVAPGAGAGSVRTSADSGKRTRSTAVMKKGTATAPGGSITAPKKESTRRKRTSMKGKQIGSLLVKKGVVTEEQLEKALDIQDQKGGLVGQILTEMGICKKADIGAALKKQRTITTVVLEGIQFEKEAVSLLARDFCEKYRLIAFEKIGNHLCVAMANVLDAQAKNDIKESTQLQIKTFDAGWQDIKSAIDANMGAAASAPAVAPAAEKAAQDDMVIELPEEELIAPVAELPGAEPEVIENIEELSELDIIEEPDVIEDLSIQGIEEVNREEETVDISQSPSINEDAVLIGDIGTLPSAIEDSAGGDIIISSDEIEGIEEVDEAPEPVMMEEEEEIVDLAAAGITEDIDEIQDIEDFGDEIEEVTPPSAPSGTPLPSDVIKAIPLSQGYFAEIVQWGAADAERRWLAEHLADNILPVIPTPELKPQAVS